MSSLCKTYDFTLAYDDTNSIDQYNILFETLKGITTKWAFQLEQGDSGYKHYQGKLVLIKKRHKSTILKMFFNEYDFIKTIHLSPTVKGNLDKWDYVTKLDTRIDGPWTSDDAQKKPLTKQLQIFNTFEMYDWQKKLEKKSQEFCMRTIDLIYDIDGNTGKSIFSEYMEYNGFAEEIPPFRLMDDIFQWVCSFEIKNCYIIDMPRGMKKDKLADFYSGIEVIKNGVAYDKRYKGRKIRFDRPRIFIFTNTLPEFKLMSKDRWNVWTLYHNNLKKYNIDPDCYIE